MMTELIPVAQPRLPAAEALLPYLQEIDANRYYSNYGPLNKRLESALAMHYGIQPECVTTVVNGTTGLTLAIMALVEKVGGYCLMPSWTFAATGHAVLAAGLVPYFLDVDEQTWALDPAKVEKAIRRLKGHVAAIMPISPFGAPLDISEWDELSTDSGIPVVIDAAAGFDSLIPGDAPAIVSLHATKVLGVGEGGFVVSRRPDIVTAIQLRANFGFQGRREAAVASLNGKLNEYGAAVGLASLSVWEDTWKDFASSIAGYRHHATQSGHFFLQHGFGERWVGTNCTVRVDRAPASTYMDRLRAMGIDSRAWYGEGLHVQSAFRHFPRDGELPVTRMLSQQTIGLPLYRGMGDAVIDKVSFAMSTVGA